MKIPAALLILLVLVVGVISTESEAQVALIVDDCRETGHEGFALCKILTPSPTSTSTPTNSPTSTPTTAPTETPTAVATATNTAVPPTATPVPPTATATPVPQPVFPMRLAFYYPWFPEAWNQAGFDPFSVYTPERGFYDSSDPAIIAAHIADLKYAGAHGAIASWWDQGSPTDGRIDDLLAADNSGFKWSLYYEPEAATNPTSSAIEADLIYIRDNYTTDSDYLRVNGKPVLFVYAGAGDLCPMADRWEGPANNTGFYVVLKVFAGYLACANQPDNWHQYSPAVGYDQQGTRAAAVSPGFWLKGEATPRLARDLTRFCADVQRMVASGANFQLITTYNEWGESTTVEPATDWGYPHTAFLDALHNNGQGCPVPPTPTPTPTATPSPTPVPGSSVVVLAAGDIAGDTPGDTITANMIAGQTFDALLTLGDNTYPNGAASEFTTYYHPTWGAFKAKTYPSAGNHDYLTSGASGYYGYFGAAVRGPNNVGYYSFNLGAWHFVVLNSNCTPAGGCGTTSPQANWLRSDLAANPSNCTLAYWHHPRFTKAQYSDQTAMSALYQILYDNNADIVLAGHDHNYQRFQPMNGAGVFDAVRGIRSWVVGTGGRSHYNTLQSDSRREAGNGDTYGLLKLTLSPNSYQWQFLPEPGRTFTDSGSGNCH